MAANPNDPRVLERLRRMSGEERISLAGGLYAMAEHIAAAGVHYEHPEWDDAQVQDEVRRRFDRSRAVYSEPRAKESGV